MYSFDSVKKTDPEIAEAIRLEMERQQSESRNREMISAVIPEDGSPVKCSAVIDYLIENHPFQRAKAYQILNDVIKTGWLVKVDRSTVKLNTEQTNR